MQIEQEFNRKFFLDYTLHHNDFDLDSTPRFLVGDTAHPKYDFQTAQQLHHTAHFDTLEESIHQLQGTLALNSLGIDHKLALMTQQVDQKQSIASIQDSTHRIDSSGNKTDCAYAYNVAIPGSNLIVNLGQKISRVANSQYTRSRYNHSLNLSTIWDLNENASLRFNYVESENSPTTIQQPYLNPIDGITKLVPGALNTEFSHGYDIGIDFDTFENRLNGSFSLYQTHERNRAYRDWQSEFMLNSQYANFSDETLAPVILRNFALTKQEGVALNIASNPNRNLSFLLNGYHDWSKLSPTTGGKTKAGAFGRYVFSEGRFKGLRIGGGLRYQDNLIYNDGYQLPQTLLTDILIDYTWTPNNGLKFKLAINLKNLADVTHQQSRFDTPNGREYILSFKTNF